MNVPVVGADRARGGQPMKRRSLEPAKRIGLCCPIQIPERRRVPMGLMLCPFVVVVRIDGYWTNVIRSRRRVPQPKFDVRSRLRAEFGIRDASVVVRLGTEARVAIATVDLLRSRRGRKDESVAPSRACIREWPGRRPPPRILPDTNRTTQPYDHTEIR